MVIFPRMDMDRDIRVTADRAISLNVLVTLQIIRHQQWAVHILVNLVDIPDFADIILDFLVFRVRADTPDNSLGHQQLVQHHNMLLLKPLSRMPATLDSLLTLPLSMLSFLLKDVFLKVSLLPILLTSRLNRLSF